MLGQRRRRWADVVSRLYIFFVFAGQEDFPSNIAHFFNVVSMLGQRRRRWPTIKAALGVCLIGLAGPIHSLVIRL